MGIPATRRVEISLNCPFLGERKITMSSTTDKASGVANEAIGKAKQGIGSAVGSDKLKVQGAAQELKGDAQKALGDAKDAVKDGANKAAAAVNKKLQLRTVACEGRFSRTGPFAFCARLARSALDHRGIALCRLEQSS
jgi:uncharacterized protein YjbJ (UPF0337 family)